MQKPNTKLSGSLMQKRIPTLLGLLVLVGGLIAGTIIFSQGTGVFSPRAAPETTPKQVKISNLTERSFTVSFLTDQATPGFIKYGTEENKLSTQVGDERDQIRGTVGDFQLHHITVTGLEADTNYFFVLGTGAGAEFDNEGNPFSIKTAKRGGVAPAAKTIYGSVVTGSGVPAQGAIVYAKLDGAAEMSSLVKDSGSWAIPLSNARLPDGSTYATIEDTSALTITIQGKSANLISNITTTVGDFDSGSTLTLGSEGQTQVAMTDPTPPPDTMPTPPGASSSADASASAESMYPTPVPQIYSAEPMAEPASDSAATSTASASETSNATPSGELVATPSPTVKPGGLSGLLEDTTIEATAAAVEVINLEDDTHQTITTTTPKIEGKVPAKVKVKISVHSDTQIEQEVTSDENGNFELDIAALKQELEPGEHTVEYSYIDPDTGEEVIKTITFTVEPRDTSNQLALAPTLTPTPVTYGTENPYPSGGATSSASASSSATASNSASASDSASKGGVSTRSALPSTESGVPVSGSVGTTLALILGGLFFIIAGVWSYWIAGELQKND